MSKEKIKVLFYGDAPTVATGFGTVSRNVLTGLHNTGKYDISILGVNYWGDPHRFPFPIWPVGIGSRDPYGRQRCFDMMAKDFDYDVLFMLQDTFIIGSFMTQGLPKLRQLKKFVSVVYFPVDGEPKKEWLNCMNLFDVPVVYTEFGKREAVSACPSIADKLRVIPHGANLKDFFPLPKEETEPFRQEYFGKHASKFVITNVNRNQQRKDIPRLMLAYKEFKKRRPDSVLYLHMAPTDQGWNLPEVIAGMGLSLNEDILLPGNNFGPNAGFPVEVLNQIYNASDVVVSTTLGEGWGLSTVEAMACKVPIIFPDNTSLTEIIGEDRGFLIKSGETPDDYTVLPNDNEVVRPVASVMDMAEKLILVHDDKKLVQERVENAYEWVTSNLVWEEHIVPQWDKLITDAVSKWAKSGMRRSEPDSHVISAEEL